MNNPVVKQPYRVRTYSTLPQDEQVAHALNDILERNYDGEKGYEEAAENVEDPKLKTIFKELSSQRCDFAKEIKKEILAVGGEPAESGTFSAYMHRTWMNLKNLFTSNDTKAITEECIRGEETLVDNYEEALELGTINGNTRTLITKQLADIREAIGRLESYKETVVS